MNSRLRMVFAFLVLAAAAVAQPTSRLFDAPLLAFDASTRISETLDFDADGDVDVAGGTQVAVAPMRIEYRVHRNDGTGAFSLAGIVSFPSGGVSPQFLRSAVGDFDGNGREDVALVLASNLRLVTDVAAAIASPPPGIPLGVVAKEILALDVDLDGRDDLVVVSVTAPAPALTVVYGTANGPVPATWSIPLGAGIFDARLIRADVNGDLVPDVVLAAPLGGSVSVQTFVTGAGVLGAGPVFQVPGFSSGTPVAGDLDADGDVDLAIFGTVLNGGIQYRYQVLRRISATAFAAEPVRDGGPVTQLMDLDFDGDLDGVASQGTGSNLLVGGFASTFYFSFNDGSGVMSPAATLDGLEGLSLPPPRDLDQDGDLDLVVGRSVLCNRGTFGELANPAVMPPSPTVVADLEGDLDPDLFSLDGVDLYRNDGRGGFVRSAPVLPPLPPGPVWRGIAPSDVDGDGDADLYAVAGSPGSTPTSAYLLHNLGGDRFLDAGPFLPPFLTLTSVPTGGANPLALALDRSARVVDIDGDGDRDLVLSGTSGTVPGVQVFVNAGAGSLVPAGQILGFRLGAIGDLTGDGILDFLGFGVTTGPVVQLVPGLPGGYAAVSNATVVGAAFPNAGLAVADLDGDMDLDLAVAEPLGTRILSNNGSGSFTAMATLLPILGTGSTLQYSVGVADFDGDGDLDLAQFPASLSGEVGTVILPGTGTPFVFDNANAAVFTGLRTVFADLDGDGDPDTVSVPTRRNLRFDGALAGLRHQYGAGLAGTGGIVPVLGASGPFRLGTTVQVRLAAGLGGAAGLVAIGTAEASIPIGPGTLLLQPLSFLPVALFGTASLPGQGTLVLPWTPVPSLVSVPIRLQAGLADPAAPGGISLTRGLLLTIGP